MPANKSLPAGSILAHITATRAASIVKAVRQFDCQEADVFSGDAYAFSVRLDGNGSWCFYQRAQFDAELISLAA